MSESVYVGLGEKAIKANIYTAKLQNEGAGMYSVFRMLFLSS
jgi:hypothetical protein